jgi:Peptidase family C25
MYLFPFYKKYLIIIIFLLSFPHFAFSADIDISEYPSGLIINIENINSDYLESNRLYSRFSDDLQLGKDELPKFYFPIAGGRSLISSVEISFPKNPDLNNKDKSDFLIFSEKQIYRNIEFQSLVFNPFIFTDEAKVLIPESAIIKIKYSNLQTLSNKKNESFTFAVNKKIIPKLLKISKTKNKSKSKLSSDSSDHWFDSNIDYSRIITNSDDIYKIDFGELKNSLPSLENKKLNNIHIISGGKSYDYFFIESLDDKFNSGDKIYLLGKQKRGDSTRFDHYTDDVAFFVYADDTKGNNRLTKAPNVQTNKKQNSAYFNKHIEFESEYHNGLTERAISLTDVSEGWYDNILNYSSNFSNKFYRPIFLVSDKVNDVNLSMNFKSLVYKMTFSTKFEYLVDLNINSVNDQTLSYKVDLNSDDWNKNLNITHNFSKSKNSFVNGQNLIGALANKVSNNIFSKIGIDYFTVEGKLVCVTEDDIMTFSSGTLTENTQINTFGFSSPNIFVIDTISRNFSKISGESGVFLSSGISFSSGFASLSVAGEMIYTDSSKYNIGIYSGGDTDFYKTNIENDFIELIKSIKDEDLFSIAAEIDIASDELISVLKNIDIPTSALTENVVSALGQVGNVKSEGSGTNISANTWTWINLENAKTYSARIKLNSGSHDVIVSSNTNNLNAKISKVNNLNLRSEGNEADGIIITNSKLMDGAKAYLKYKKESHPDKKFILLDAEDVYNEFNFGSKSAHAIKNLVKYSMANWEIPPSYLILLGDASWDSKHLIYNSTTEDLVPTFGNPSSDVWYGMFGNYNGFKGIPHIDLAVGRIPANRNNQVYIYLDKLKAFEQGDIRPWKKKAMALIGLDSSESIQYYRNPFLQFLSDLRDEPFCIDTNAILNNDTISVSTSRATEIKSEIADGKAWVIFMGHGAYDKFDMDGWQEEKLNNKGRTGILTTVSCTTGAFAESFSENSRNEAYILYPETGFVAATGSVSLGLVGTEISMIREFLTYLKVDENKDMPLGFLMNYSKNFLGLNGDGINRIMQYQLIGDPMIRFPFAREGDIYFDEASFELSSNNDNNDILDEDDSLAQLSIDLHNIGYTINDKIRITCTHIFGGDSVQSSETFSTFCLDYNYSNNIQIKNLAGRHKLIIEIELENDLNSENKENNIFTYQFDVFSSGLLPLDPLAGWNVKSQNPTLRFINPLSKKYNYTYSFEIKDSEAKSIYKSSVGEISEEKSHIDWNPEVILKNNSHYTIFYEMDSDNPKFKKNIFSLDFSTFVSKAETVKIEFDLSKIPNFSKDNNFEYSKENQSLRISNDSITVDIVSIRGNSETGKWVQAEIGDSTYLDNYRREGIFVITIPKENSGIGELRYYNTPNTVKDDEGINRPDTTILYPMVRFLRDSVSADDYIFIANCGEAYYNFDRLEKTDFAFIDSVKTIYKRFGAVESDKLQRLNTSYALFGWIGADPNEIRENINTQGDSASISIKIPLYNSGASFRTKSIGPAKKWKNLIISRTGDNSILSSNVFENNSENILSTNNLKLTDTLSLENIENEMLSFSFLLEKEKYYDRPNINNISVEFLPLAEIAIENISQTDTVLRADTAFISFDIKNLSLRTSGDEIEYDIKFADMNEKYIKKTISISKNEITSASISIDTYFLKPENEFIINTEIKNSSDELYKFNNFHESTLFTTEDTTKPTILIYMDGWLAQSGDYIADSATVGVELYDNSRLQISSADNFTLVRFNGIIADSLIIFSNNFDFDNNNGLRARITFPTQNIEYDDYPNSNLLKIAYEDASGNFDTTLAYFNISRKSYVDEITNYPNPFASETTFLIDLHSGQGLSGEISVYNISGEVLRTMKTDLHVGQNHIDWDGQDENGNSLPRAHYFYSVKILSNGDVNNFKSGKTIKINN